MGSNYLVAPIEDGSTRDFREFYDLAPALEAGKKALGFSFFLRTQTMVNAARRSLGRSTEHSGYTVARLKDRFAITFGREENNPLRDNPDFAASWGGGPGNIIGGYVSGFAISPASEDVLLLSAGGSTPFTEGTPLLALRYGVYEKELVIGYAQTPSHVMLEDYLLLKEDLGARPHEFLIAQFLARIAPVLHADSKTVVKLKSSISSSRKTLRERFFDKKTWRLSPSKQRVRQILGEGNAWLSEDAIKHRVARFERKMRIYFY